MGGRDGPSPQITAPRPVGFWAVSRRAGSVSERLPMALYVIRNVNTGNRKIGHAKDPWRRRAALQTANAHHLHVDMIVSSWGEEEEELLHKRFAHLRIGGEWFSDCQCLRVFIAYVRFTEDQSEWSDIRHGNPSIIWADYCPECRRGERYER